MTDIAQWQKALWRFTQVGHIGKLDGPKAWKEPVTPLADAREVRLKIPAPTDGKRSHALSRGLRRRRRQRERFRRLGTSAPRRAGPAGLAACATCARSSALTAHREKIFSSTAKCLAAAAEVDGVARQERRRGTRAEARRRSRALAAWLDYLGIGAGEARIESHFTEQDGERAGYDFIKGWTGADTLSVLANSSDQHVRIPGNMKPHSVAVHPSPKLRVVVGWRSPVAATLRVEAKVQHAHPECGNGVTWSLELRRGSTRQRLAAGTAQGAKEVKFGPLENLAVQPGDLVSLLIGPRDGNHSCDLTAVDLDAHSDGDGGTNGTSRRMFRPTFSPAIRTPTASATRASGISTPSRTRAAARPDRCIPAGSLLAKWQSSASAEEKQQLAERSAEAADVAARRPGEGQRRTRCCIGNSRRSAGRCSAAMLRSSAT